MVLMNSATALALTVLLYFTEKLAQQTFDDVVFTTVGADPSEYDIVGVKSSNHFRAWFEPRAKAIVTADPPGIHTCNLKNLPFENIKCPVFPLDEDTEFEL